DHGRARVAADPALSEADLVLGAVGAGDGGVAAYREAAGRATDTAELVALSAPRAGVNGIAVAVADGRAVCNVKRHWKLGRCVGRGRPGALPAKGHSRSGDAGLTRIGRCVPVEIVVDRAGDGADDDCGRYRRVVVREAEVIFGATDGRRVLERISSRVGIEKL